ncbi:ExbD/TolR family protein [Polyangium jinanense]|uniref:Biopolymer transporter ExbD n=1 Tax=Polyangium jinanense TaxID=2829994 RepID=A0A9X4AT87_9BACT|nr:biopolymer transporter ExbD [Polyangium jinanense]MDC3981920.1 biopolymer transporter ExbD [Polyangium jinanense]
MAMNVSSSGKNGAIAPAMNVTPLVDVVLVLLIIFMVVTPLLNKQLWLNLPKKDEDAKNEPPPDADKPVVLTVDAKGAIRINQTEVSRAELRDRLTRIFAARGDKLLYFDAADDAPYGITVEVMDIAKRGGAKGIAILTEKLGG